MIEGKDKRILRGEMAELFRQLSPIQLQGLERLLNGMQSYRAPENPGAEPVFVAVTNDLSLADFGEAFCDALHNRLDPNKTLLEKVRQIFFRASGEYPSQLTAEELERAVDAMQVGLGL